jgi:hypothetical protein
MKYQKSKVVNMTADEIRAARQKGPAMTDEELATQIRRYAKRAARNIGLTTEDARISFVEFPIPSEEQKSAEEILGQNEIVRPNATGKKRRRKR